MIVLGIDPGTRHLGWGIVRREGTRPTHVAHGVIDTDVTASIAVRLCQIEVELVAVLAAYAPTASVVETMFFSKDATAAAKLGHARGVALLVLARAGLPIAELEPTKVKRTIVGHGRADKRQVAQMIATILRLPAPPRADAADALAIALAHAQAAGFTAQLATARSSRPTRIIPKLHVPPARLV
jgi:crossover junction endodeoxyribonuclease RuvC